VSRAAHAPDSPRMYDISAHTRVDFYPWDIPAYTVVFGAAVFPKHECAHDRDILIYGSFETPRESRPLSSTGTDKKEPYATQSSSASNQHHGIVDGACVRPMASLPTALMLRR